MNKPFTMQILTAPIKHKQKGVTLVIALAGVSPIDVSFVEHQNRSQASKLARVSICFGSAWCNVQETCVNTINCRDLLVQIVITVPLLKSTSDSRPAVGKGESHDLG